MLHAFLLSSLLPFQGAIAVPLVEAFTVRPVHRARFESAGDARLAELRAVGAKIKRAKDT